MSVSDYTILSNIYLFIGLLVTARFEKDKPAGYDSSDSFFAGLFWPLFLFFRYFI